VTSAGLLDELDLEPSRISARTYATRRRHTKLDAATVISFMIALLLLIPSRLLVPGLPDVGRPALIVCLVMFAWWVLVRLTSSRLVLAGPQPIRWAIWAFALSMVISYAIGQLRGLSTLEANGANNEMLWFCTFMGVALMTADGISNWLRLHVVLRTLVVCGAIMAGIGLIQYVTKIDITQYLNIPGLVSKRAALGFEDRGDGIRVASTATHYIELSAALATILPFGIHYAIFTKERKPRIWYTIAALTIAAGIAVTISRTGMLALGIVLFTIFPVWTWRLRYNVFIVIGSALAAFAVIQPGLLKTLTSLFDDPSQNPAFTVREARYPYVFHFVDQRPWFGRGTGTYVNPQYWVLDNQWLDLLITNGIVGVTIVALVHITGVTVGILAARRARTMELKSICAAAVAGQFIAPVVAGTFDSFAFMTYSTLIALTLGLCGTVWRLTHPARVVRTSTALAFEN
jgi:hypothetical protein